MSDLLRKEEYIKSYGYSNFSSSGICYHCKKSLGYFSHVHRFTRTRRITTHTECSEEFIINLYQSKDPKEFYFKIYKYENGSNYYLELGINEYDNLATLHKISSIILNKILDVVNYNNIGDKLQLVSDKNILDVIFELEALGFKRVEEWLKEDKNEEDFRVYAS